MQALTSSCSKAIVERLRSSSPRDAVHVSDRPEFCFSLRSRYDKKGCNFWLLKLVQNNGIYPVHALPPKSQVDLETEEPQAQQSEQTSDADESKFVRVAFQLQKICNFGEQFLIVGDDPKLGSWDPLDALPMTWSDGHIWTVELDMPTGKSIQFKFILKGKGGDIIWQPGSDRIINTWETVNRITVCEDWENAELQKIIEEDPLALSNEEPQVDSEVSTFDEILDNPQEGLESDVSELSGIEDIQTNSEEKPLAEPVLQQITGDSVTSSMEKSMPIVAENIGSSEDLIKSTSHQENERSMIHQCEESADSLRNVDIIHDLGHNGNAAPLKNQERTILDGSLLDFEGGPVLVPGLIPPTVPTEQAGPGEVEERTTVDTSIGAFETKDQNIPEFNKEQESNDGAPQEINATINNEPELHDNEYEEQCDLDPAMEERPNSQPVDGNLFQNDIQWGRETVKKFLTKLGLL
ncbi:uncharacterized protein LOC133306500 [Gastrolobium bilobum]|uniref:uncharacterized protein LOC133306500 n=1 Tax=Gastrolobium bilobum TaxID=150636 RepID=UPI002AB29F11|nr:uncharacterized protein LOC133306500 [Gastrolobium bilobum]